MNGPDVLASARQQLLDAVAHHTAPALSPLNITPWLAMSALQKAIRRADDKTAIRAAATLLVSAPERLWRRCGVIVFEDIGVADLDTAAIVTAALGGKRYRAALGGEWQVASCIVNRMVRARKCRAADDLLLVAEQNPAHQKARGQLAELSTPELLGVMCSGASLPERALALWYALGTDRRPSPRLHQRKGDASAVFDALCEAGHPHSVVEIAREGFRKTGEVLGPFVALLSAAPPERSCQTVDDDIPPAVMIGETPGWSFDLYSREGRGTLQRFLHGDSELAKWLREHVPLSARLALLGSLLFRVDGGATRARLRWPTGDALKLLVDIECCGPFCLDATESLQLMRVGMDALNEVRRHG